MSENIDRLSSAERSPEELYKEALEVVSAIKVAREAKVGFFASLSGPEALALARETGEQEPVDAAPAERPVAWELLIDPRMELGRVVARSIGADDAGDSNSARRAMFALQDIAQGSVDDSWSDEDWLRYIGEGKV